MLNGLSDVGFNAIKLPMWPYTGDEILGSVRSSQIGSSLQNFTRDECDKISMQILEVLRHHELSNPNEDDTSYYDDDYHYFKVMWGPGYESRQYQSDLTEF